MKCICMTKCYVASPRGTSYLYTPGKIEEFKTCPKHFEPVDKNEVDFAKAGEEEMMAKTWKISDAKAIALELYGVEIKGNSKAAVAKAILDARYRNA